MLLTRAGMPMFGLRTVLSEWCVVSPWEKRGWFVARLDADFVVLRLEIWSVVCEGGQGDELWPWKPCGAGDWKQDGITVYREGAQELGEQRMHAHLYRRLGRRDGVGYCGKKGRSG